MIGISGFARSYLRSRATALMENSTDTCVIRRPGPEKVEYDPVTRKAKRTSTSVLYTGACRLWQINGGGDVWTQDRELIVSTTKLSIPWDADLPEPGDIVTMTGSDDPEVVGRSLKIETISRGGGLRGSRVLNVTFVDTMAEDF